MCTVSAAYSTDGETLRLVINRDERRGRMLAQPPARFEPYGVPAIWPVDQHSGGTWTAINAHGLAFAILNASPAGSHSASTSDSVTRGAIIPHLAAAADLVDVERRFATGPANWRCRPFKLLVASMERVIVLTPAGAGDLTAPLLLSTSSLGDHLVEAPRRALFEELLSSSTHAWQAQDRLHQHAWPDRRHLSVLMSRADACTVSRTEIRLSRQHSEMRYVAIHEGWPAGVAVPTQVLVHRRAAVAA
jgi:hypothetical protein